MGKWKIFLIIGLSIILISLILAITITDMTTSSPYVNITGGII